MLLRVVGGGVFKIVNKSFNTTLVLLRVAQGHLAWNWSPMFQHHSGAIEGVTWTYLL